jgi:hypothetical protein
MCYIALEPKWSVWSAKYILPLTKTTLRGLSIYAPIAGKDLPQPAKPRDAIWSSFYHARGTKSRVPTFKTGEIQLALVIDFEDFLHAEEKRELEALQRDNKQEPVSKSLSVSVNY